MVSESIAANLSILEERIQKACIRSGRKRDEVRLMGVSKFQSSERVGEAWKAGLRLFGESRVQEGVKKFTDLREKYQNFCEAEIHLIGSLQRNKAGAAALFFDCIQSVDRLQLIDELGTLTRERKNPLMVLLEYRTGEETKSGFSSAEELYGAVERVLSFSGLIPAGLMTIAPFTGDDKTIRSAFRELRKLKDELVKRFPSGDWSCLSMGMTADFEIAIEEGSTMVRIGTAIFGNR